MQNLRYRLLSLIILLGAVFAASAETTFKLLPVRDAIQGHRFNVVFELSSDDENLQATSEPAAFEIESCRLYAGPGTSTSYQHVFTNGRSVSTSSVRYTYAFIAEKVGEFTVPSVTLQAGGKTYKSNPQKFTVVADNSPQSQNNAGNNRGNRNHHQGGSTGNVSVGKVTAKDLMVNISFSKSSVYEQEPVIASIKLYLRYDCNFTIDGSTFKAIKLPAFDGFLSEDLAVEEGNKLENINGQVYNTWEIKRALLFPQKNGRLKVHSGEYEITVVEYEWVSYGFMQTRREVPRTMSTATNTATIQVKSLPEPRPADFSGAVGQFTIASELSTDVLKTNEAANYSLIIKGSGNIKYLSAPTVEFPNTFDKYTAKTDINATFNGSTYNGTFRIDYPFVPQEIGKFTIPAKNFVYFNPASNKYVTLEAQGYDVNVSRGASVQAPIEQRELDTSINDILHIHTLPAKIAPADELIANTTIYWLAYLFATLALISGIVIYRRHIKRSADVAGRRLARANRVATKRFKAAAAFMKKHESEQFYEELARALKGYIGDKLGIAPSQLISDTIVEKLTAFGATSEDAESVVDVLNECEMARFTPSQSDSAMSDIYDRASAAIKAIENVKTK